MFYIVMRADFGDQVVALRELSDLGKDAIFAASERMGEPTVGSGSFFTYNSAQEMLDNTGGLVPDESVGTVKDIPVIKSSELELWLDGFFE